MEKILELKYIKGGKELLFPNDINPIIITDFTYDAKRMGGVPTITASVMYDSCLDNVWDNSVFALFNGEKYFLKQTPTSSKNNTDARFKHEVSLVSERIILDNVYFYDVVSNGEENDKPVSNNSDFSFFGTIHEFARRLHESLKVSHIDYSVIVDDDISSEGELLSFSNTYFSNALQEAYNTFNIPYYFHQKEIHFGYTNNIPEQVFKYGAKDALLSITKTNNNQKLVNRITGVGSADNIPYYYPNLNPAGSAVFETTNIEQSDVKDIDMSKVLSYNNEWEGSEFVLCRKPTEFSYTTDYLHSTDRPNALKPSFQLMVGKGKATGVDGCISGYPLSFTTPDKSGLLMDLCTIQAYELHIEGGMQYLFYLNEVPNLENVGEELGKFQNDIYIGRVANGHTIGKLKEISAEEWIEDGFFPDGYIPCGSNADGTGESVIKWTPLRGNFTTTTKLSGKYVLLMVSRYYIALNMRNRDVIATFAPCYLGEESNDWAYNYLTISAFENSIHAFKYNTDGYVNYEDSGISLVKLSDAPCADITYSVSSDFKINKNISNEETATRIKITGRNYINPMPNLMPSIYRNSLGNERFYNALNETYKNPETGQYYIFNNPYVVGRPKEHIQDFEDIKPTIVGSTNNISWKENEVIVKQRFDMFAEFAYDVNDNEEIGKETNEYLHPYFFAKLRKMNFNLFDHAIEDGEMTISMTSGTCGGCNFVIGADEFLRNPVQVYEEDTTIDGILHKKGSLKRDAQGNVIASGTPQDIQNDTTNNEVWIALKKEEDTFGVMMPNATHKYYPKSCESDTTNDGDTFVILNIDLPQSYILDAEKRLEEHLIQYMSENNDERFSFSISFSRIYFAENPEVLALINENTRLTIEYNGEKHLLYISSYQYKMKGDEHLPEIIVELSDELTVSQNAIQNAVSEVKNEMLYRLGNIDWLAIGQKYFLRKDSTSDTSKAKTMFKKQVSFGEESHIEPTGDAIFKDVSGQKATFDKFTSKNGVVDIDGNADISGDANIDKSLDVTKNLLVGGDTNISGSAEVGGDATIARQTTTKTAKVKESLEIGDYQEGDFGYGGKMYVDENGNSHIVVDHAVFRKKAEFNEITVKELKHVGGVIVLSAAAMIASRVEKVDGGWKCYFKNTDSDGNRILNEFVVGDMVRCQTFNMGDSDATTRFLTLGETYIRVGDSLLTANSIPLNRYYWRTLTEVGTDYIVMSETDCDPSVENDEPMVGDNIVLFGSKASLKRQNVIILSAYGKDAPSRKVFQGINDYTLVDKLVYGEYFDYTTNKSKSVMYGDSYVGKRDESTYVKYTTENGVEVKGKMHIERGSTGASNLTDFGDEMLNNAQKLVQGKYNLIRNSGFTGDYVTDILFESTVQNPDSEMYSPPLDHWAIGVGTATVNDSVISESGKEVALLSCSLSQTLESPLIKGENYILSLKAKGAMDMSLNIYNNSNEERNYVQFDLTESWGKYTYSFVASDNHTHITFWSSDCSMCEIQLERGNIPSAWGRSFLDNQTTLAYYKSLTYLSDAIANGSTDVLGGLILTSMINLGNYKDGKLVKSTAGTSGVYNDDDDVAFWAGGSLEQAIALVTKIKANPKYQPTIEEWVNLAKYVVTHGGDTIMKGTIFADNGYFRGRLEAKEGYFNGEVSIADGKIQMNTDGSGHLANGNISWDKNGKTTINSSINAENLYRGICIVWGWEVPNSGGQLYGKYKYLNLDKEGNYKEYCYIKGLDRLQAIANSIEWTSDENGEEVEVTDEMRNEWLKFYNIGTYIVWNGSPLHKVGVSLDEVNSDEVLRCTYNADFIQLVDGSKRYGKGFPEQGSVYLPRPQDFKGKMVEVDHASTSNTKVTNELGNTYDTNAWVKCVDGIFYLGTIYNENTNDIEVQVNSETASVNIASGSIARFYSLGSVWLVMSRKEALKNN